MALMRNTIPEKTSSDCRVKFFYDGPISKRSSHGYILKLFGLNPVEDDKLFNELLNYCRATFKGYVYYVEYASGRKWAIEFFFKSPADAMLFKLMWGCGQ